ncbi:MAG: sn-glycerol-3-phosphate ABC transporter ATP-binding protein UgpC [Spirochaetes bacterium]|nr:sn-glycerol-3-phosphate ABC transporter ATP-binding protein UgpC [Spirochaetota bacterium]
MAEVKLQNICKRYGRTEVIRDVSIHVKNGEFITLVGPSGCGKTTILRMIAGLERITSGSLYIGDVLSNDIPSKKRGISMVFQSYALFPHMTVSENIAFGLKIKKYGRNEILERVKWAADFLNLNELESRMPKELSGGQRQRVAFARALVLEPDVLLLDEPLSNLDAKLRLKMRSELKRIHRKLNTTIIYVTHDQVEAMSLSNRVVVMNKGVIAQTGSPLEVYNSPSDIFVAGFIGSPAMNFLNGIIIKDEAHLFIDFDGFKLIIPEELRSNCEKYSGKEIIFGIRPEDITDKRFSLNNEENSIDAIIEVVEPLGDKDMIEAATGDTVLTFTADPGKTESGMHIKIGFNMIKSHFFDKETGKIL